MQPFVSEPTKNSLPEKNFMLNQFLPHSHLEISEFLILTENPVCSWCTDCPLQSLQYLGIQEQYQHAKTVRWFSCPVWWNNKFICISLADEGYYCCCWTQGLSSCKLLHNFFYILIEALNRLPKSFSSTEKAHLPSSLNNSLNLQAQLYFWKTSLLLTYKARAHRQTAGQLW